MNINDVIALSKAGFSSAQIAQMAIAAAQNPEPAPAQDNKADFDAILAAIGGLKTQLHQQAIQTAQQPAQQQQPTAEDMLASIINPPAAVNDNK